jgi:3-dehydroquinate dehydratase-2
VEAMCRAEAGAQPVEFRQTNSETQLIDWVHEAIDNGAGIIINPAAYTFTSLALFDALKMFPGPIIELHISNIHARDELHRHSKLSSAVKAVIAGLGAYGYIVAMQAALHALGKLPRTLPAPLRTGPR